MKKRIDILLVEKFKLSRSKAQSLITDGLVKVGQKTITKSSELIEEADDISITEHKQYVSRGAHKLLGAIEAFDLHFNNRVVLDMGASTGGFTQVALENGAKKVYSVDVGKGELDKTLVANEKVVNMESCDIRNLNKDNVLDIDFIVGDLSFISLQHLLPHINRLFGNIEMTLLFKPQFECGKEVAKKYKGVIKDEKVHIKLLTEFIDSLKIYGWTLSNLTYSPIKGKSGNIEYLLHINGQKQSKVDIKQITASAFKNLK